MSAIPGGSLGFSPLRASLKERYGVEPISAPHPQTATKHYGLSHNTDGFLPGPETLMLDLRARRISRSELMAIATRLPTCSKLESESTSVKSLDLRNTSLSRECAPALGNLLARNRSIQHMDLRWNNLGAQSEQYILSGLQSNPVIRTVELSGNDFSPECVSAAEKICRRNRESVDKFNLPPYDPDAEAKLRVTRHELHETASEAAKSRREATHLKGSLANADSRIGQLQASNYAYELSLSKLTRELQLMRTEMEQVRDAADAREEALKNALADARGEAQRYAQEKEDAELAAQRTQHAQQRDIASLQHKVRALQADCREAELALAAAKAEAAEECKRADAALQSKSALEERLRGEMEDARQAAARRAEEAQEMHEKHLAQLREALARETDRVAQLQSTNDELQQQLDAAAKAKEAAVANERRRVTLEWQRKLEAETSQLRAELSDANAETKLAQESLRSATEMHAAERERLQASANTYQQRAQAADREAEELRGEAAALQAQMASMKREEASLRASVKRLHAIKEELTAECIKLRQQVADAEADKQAALLRQRKQLEQYLSDREARIVALKREIMGNKARMDKLLSDTGRQMQNLYAQNIASFKRQVLEYDRLAVPNLEQSGAAFPPMSPDVMGALMSDDESGFSGQNQPHPSAAEIAEEQMMYSNALQQAEHSGLPPAHRSDRHGDASGVTSTTAKPSLWTETPPRVRVGSSTSAAKHAFPQSSPASTSSFASPGTESQSRTPAQPGLQKQPSNEPLVTMQMLHNRGDEQVRDGSARPWGNNVRLSLSGSGAGSDSGHSGSSGNAPQTTSPYSDGEGFEIEDEEV